MSGAVISCNFDQFANLIFAFLCEDLHEPVSSEHKSFPTTSLLRLLVI